MKKSFLKSAVLAMMLCSLGSGYASATVSSISIETDGVKHVTVQDYDNASAESAEGNQIYSTTTGHNVVTGMKNKVGTSTSAAGSSMVYGWTNTLTAGGNVFGSGNTLTSSGYVFGDTNYVGSSNSTVIGTQNCVSYDKTNGKALVPTGDSGEATGTYGYNVALGYQNTIGGVSNAIAIGYLSSVTANEGIAIGHFAQASGEMAVAIGYAAVASGGATQVGDGTKGNDVFMTTVSFGHQKSEAKDDKTYLARLKNIYEGSDDNDAVNVKQLKSYVAANAGKTYTGTDPITVDNTNNTISIRNMSMGADATGSSAEAKTNAASIALGQSATASGYKSLAFGYNSQATKTSATAYGESAQATGIASVALGSTAQATEDDTVAVGKSAKATNTKAVAIGRESEASGSGSVALGYQANSNNWWSIAIGYQVNQNTTAGLYSVAIGSTSKAAGEGAVAIGDSAKAEALNSVALGKGSKATEAKTVSVGSGNSSQAYGFRRIVNVADGTANIDAATYGQLVNAKADNSATPVTYTAYTPDDDGIVTVETNNGGTAFKLDLSSFATGDNLIIGDDTNHWLDVSWNGATTSSDVTRGANSAAYGYQATASGEAAVALGYNARAELSNSVALGTGSIVTAANTVSVGSGKDGDDYETRRIMNVTDGEADTDAATYGQIAAKVNSTNTVNQVNLSTEARTGTNLGNSNQIVSNNGTVLATFTRVSQETGAGWAEDLGFVAGADLYNYSKPVKAENATSLYTVSETATTGTNLGLLDNKIGDMASITKTGGNLDGTKSIAENLTKLDSAIQQVAADAGYTGSDTITISDKVISVKTDGKVESGNKGIVTGGAVYDAISKQITEKATYTAGDHVTISNNQVSVNTDGEVASGDSGIVTGGAVYTAVQGSYVDGNLYTISANKREVTVQNKDGSTAFKLKVEASAGGVYTSGDHINIDNDYNISVKTDGKVESGDTGIVTGGTVYEAITDKTGDTSKLTEAGLSDNLTDSILDVNEKVDDVTNQVVDVVNNSLGTIRNDINKVGAGAAALAALRPETFNPDDKWSFAVGYGHYKNANSGAFGAFYKPNQDTTVSVGSTIGNGDPMMNVGVSFKIGARSKGASIYSSNVELVREVNSLRAGDSKQKQVINEQAKRIIKLESENAVCNQKIDAQAKEIGVLKEENAEMKAQIAQIMKKLDLSGTVKKTMAAQKTANAAH